MLFNSFRLDFIGAEEFLKILNVGINKILNKSKL